MIETNSLSMKPPRVATGKKKKKKQREERKRKHGVHLLVKRRPMQKLPRQRRKVHFLEMERLSSSSSPPPPPPPIPPPLLLLKLILVPSLSVSLRFSPYDSQRGLSVSLSLKSHLSRLRALLLLPLRNPMIATQELLRAPRNGPSSSCCKQLLRLLSSARLHLSSPLSLSQVQSRFPAGS
jgi:hypothetical protein